MTLLAITFGHVDHASSRTRVFNFLPLLRKDGISITVLPAKPVQKKSLFFPLYRISFKLISKIIRFVFLAFFHWDAVWVHRVFLSRPELWLIKVRETKLVFDFDDAIFLGSTQNRQKTQSMVRHSVQTILSTPFLSEFCRESGKEPVVITTPVDTSLFFPDPEKKTKTEIVIGWTGSPSTAKYLINIFPTLEEIGKKYPQVQFLFTGINETVKIGDSQTFCSPWSLSEEPVLIRKMDIGMMPLPDDEWSRSKGGYKIFLYFASGIPAVVSPVGINSQIVTVGQTGFTATTREEWVKNLSFLIESKDLREKMGRNALEEARNTYSIQACYNQLSTIFKTLTK